MTYIKSKKFHKTSHSKRSCALVSLFLICSIVCLGLIYLIQTNGLVGSSYQIRQLQGRLSELEIENKDLETKSAYYQSPTNLDKLVQLLDLVEVHNVIYLEKEKAVAVVKE